LLSPYPYFSIIIPTYNRPQALAACLTSLRQLDYPRDGFEVIVVDDGSLTSLDPIVAPFRHQLSLQLITQANTGPATARNTGAKAAKGDILAFTDDDCQPFPDWLKQLAIYFPRDFPDSPLLVGGHTHNALPKKLYATASQGLVDYLYQALNESHDHAVFFTSNNFAVPTSSFLKLGGFDETFTLAAGEDREFCARWQAQGYRLVYTPNAKVNHAHPLTLSSFWRQQFNYGRGAFHFHRRQRQRKAQGQSWSFYRQLLQYPSQRWRMPQSLSLTGLFFLSQVAVAMGLLTEAMQNQAK
jgi:glycosyltransferase involved in cell wall biosynthesis